MVPRPRHARRTHAWVLGLSLLGCGDRVLVDSATETTAGSTSSPTGTGTGATETPPPACDLFAQDCPAGQKCSSDGDAPLCVPIDPNPGGPGAPCAVHGPGLDDCALGGYCWVDEVCHPLCTGTAEAPICPEGQICVKGDGLIPICTQACAPLEQDCPEGQVCVIPSTGVPACGPDVSGAGGEAGDVCQYVNGCDPGNQCDQTGTVPNCGGDQCCTPFCDASAPAPICPVGQSCLLFYAPGTAPAGLEQLGTCGAG